MARAKRVQADPTADAATPAAATPKAKKYTPEQLNTINQLAAALLAGVSTGLHPDAILGRCREAYAHAEAMLAVSEEVAAKEA